MRLENIIKKILKEATGDSTGSRGSYTPPLQPGLRPFKKNNLEPFSIQVSHYDSPLNEYDSYDGKMSLPKKTIKRIETKAKKVTNYIKKHPYSTFSDEDGNNINPTPSGKQKNKKLEYVPIRERNKKLNEDLAVWFGKKKKPKGSSQPKGPWVDICRKVDGKHPPCGRSDASTGSYPKCRAAGVAGKMSDSQKRSACQQKRRAEKNDPQSGKGQKPVMVSHKKKTNESMKRKIITLTEDDLTRIVKRILNEQTDPPTIKENQQISLKCKQVSIVMGQNDKPFLKIGQEYYVDGNLQTHSTVLQPESFSDLGRKISDPYGTGFKTTYDDSKNKVALKFFVKELGPQLPQGYEPSPQDSAISDHNFLLKPVTKDESDLLSSKTNASFNDGDRIIFEVLDNNSIYGFCRVEDNKPDGDFLETLTNNWDLNNITI